MSKDLPSTAAGTVTHSVIPIQGSAFPGANTAAAEVFDERLNQTDIRLLKNIRMGRGKVQAIFDVYNLFNNDSIRAFQETFPVDATGVAWGTPITLLSPRFMRLQINFDF